MSRYPRMAVLAVLALGVFLAGCNKDEKPAASSGQSRASAPLAVPPAGDDDAWRTYVGQQIGKNIKRRSMPPFALYLNADEESRENQILTMKNTVMRPIQRDTTLGFGSFDSSLLASRLGEVFASVPEGAFSGIRVVFVGKAEDRVAVEEAVKASGAELVFVEIGS